MKLVPIAIALALAIVPAVEAVEVAGVDLPEALKAGETELVLNGAGVRTKTIFRIKAYAAGLYLPRKSSNAVEIVNADAPIAVRMIVLRKKISSEQTVQDWVNAFEMVTNNHLDLLGDDMDKFFAFFNEDSKRGDTYDLIYLPGVGVQVYFQGKLQGAVGGLFFKKAVFGTWIGSNPIDGDLKKELLGG